MVFESGLLASNQKELKYVVLDRQSVLKKIENGKYESTDLPVLRI